MVLTVGDRVVYPCQGPCLVSSVVEKVVAEAPKSFYRLTLLDGSGGELFVPLDGIRAIGIRMLLNKSEIPKLLSTLMMTAEIARDRRQRAKETLNRFTSGSAFELAEIVESLTELGKTTALTMRESWTLSRARKFLICEIAEVTCEPKNAVAEQIDRALEARTITGIQTMPDYLPVADPSVIHPNGRQ